MNKRPLIVFGLFSVTSFFFSISSHAIDCAQLSQLSYNQFVGILQQSVSAQTQVLSSEASHLTQDEKSFSAFFQKNKSKVFKKTAKELAPMYSLTAITTSNRYAVAGQVDQKKLTAALDKETAQMARLWFLKARKKKMSCRSTTQVDKQFGCYAGSKGAQNCGFPFESEIKCVDATGGDTYIFNFKDSTHFVRFNTKPDIAGSKNVLAMSLPSMNLKFKPRLSTVPATPHAASYEISGKWVMEDPTTKQEVFLGEADYDCCSPVQMKNTVTSATAVYAKYGNAMNSALNCNGASSSNNSKHVLPSKKTK